MFENVFQKYISAKNIVFFILAILFIIFVTKIKDIAILFFASFPMHPVQFFMDNLRNSSISWLTNARTRGIIRTNTKPLEEREVKNPTLSQRAAVAGSAAQRDC